MDSAKQSVWDALRFNVLNDTATSDSIRASDETETTTKLSFHSRIITSFNLYGIDIDQTRLLTDIYCIHIVSK